MLMQKGLIKESRKLLVNRLSVYITKIHYMLGFIFALLFLVCLVLPSETITANEICIMPPSVIVLTFLAWKAGIIHTG